MRCILKKKHEVLFVVGFQNKDNHQPSSNDAINSTIKKLTEIYTILITSIFKKLVITTKNEQTLFLTFYLAAKQVNTCFAPRVLIENVSGFHVHLFSNSRSNSPTHVFLISYLFIQ